MTTAKNDYFHAAIAKYLAASDATTAPGVDDNGPAWVAENDAWNEFCSIKPGSAEQCIDYMLVASLGFEGLESAEIDNITAHALRFASPDVAAWVTKRRVAP
tara:strand:+ start:1590 stop:1895 length:306 start_codon:yes stop_codon:yes gene_type:complete